MVVVLPAAAHGELIFQLGAERIQPGGSIEVRGDLGRGEAFAITLVSRIDGSRRVIATVPAIEEGHFQASVVIPSDVATGEYVVEASAEGTVIRAPLTIAGSPVGEAGGGLPGQDEGFAQPVPSGLGRPVVGSAAITPTAESARTAQSSVAGLAIVGVVGAAAIALVALLRTADRRRRLPPTGG
jgi:hypothetical protein